MTNPIISTMLKNAPGNFLQRIEILERQVQEIQSADYTGETNGNEDGIRDGLRVIDLDIFPAVGITVTNPQSTAYIGGFIAGDGLVYGGVKYNFGGVNAGVIQVGINTTDGTLYAINANISGVLTIGAGSTAGGWLIDASSIHDAAGMVGLSSAVTGGNDLRIWAGNTTPASAGFRVYEDGAMVATSATITGVITANTGFIGGATGWVISANTIKDVAGLTGLSNAVTGGDDIRFWAGNTTPGSAPFYVTESGALVATSATISGAITATTGAIGGWSITSTSIRDTAGTTGMSSAVTVGDDVRFWAGNVIPSSAPFRVTEAGVVTATSGTIGGWTLATTTLTAGSITLNSSTPSILMGSASAVGTGAGMFLGLAAGVYQFRVGDPAANNLIWNGSTLAANGQWIKQAGLNPSLQTWTTNIAFSSASDTQVNWSAGTITLGASGTSYSISSGNTGTMSALTYIYLDIAVSLTVLQITTTYSTAVGDGKILIATAQNATAGASVLPQNGQQPIINGNTQITALSILAGQIAAGAITAAKISVSSLSAITATMGSLTIDSTLTMNGASGAIAIGTTPPSSATVGTGLWVDRTGVYSLSSNTQNATLTSAGLSAAGGGVIIDSIGIKLKSDTYPGSGYLYWKSADTSVLTGQVISDYAGAAVNTGIRLIGQAHDSGVSGYSALWANDHNGTLKSSFYVSSTGVAQLDLTPVNGGAGSQYLTIFTKTSATSVPNNVLRIATRTTGTVANGLGTAIEYFIQNSANVDKSAGYTTINWTDKTSGSEDAQFGIGLQVAGSQITMLTLDSVAGLVVYAGTLTVSEQGTPTTPASGFGAFYVKTDNNPYYINDSGVEGRLLIGTEGVYTPTATNTTNVSATTTNSTNYYRIGNRTHVFGQITPDPVAAGACLIGISLPIASAIANSFELAGSGVFSASSVAVRIIGDATNDRATFEWTAPDGTARPLSFEFSYQNL